MSFPTRRWALAALAVAAVSTPVLAAPLSAADQGLVGKAQAYLQGLASVKGRFVQIDPRGSTSSGDLYIRRPGKARFAYDPPKQMTIVSDGSRVSVYDARLKTFNAYPLGSTPLSLFLDKDIKLQEGVEVTQVTRFPNGFAITARDGRKQARGWITLTFTDAPVRLTEWTVSDAQGARTRVKLTDLRAVPSLPDGMFVLKNPLRKPKRVGRQ
jgi:outer membrane lipoprotein-sorting protein